MLPSGATALYPEPRSSPHPSSYTNEIELASYNDESDRLFSPVLVPVNDEWLDRMQANRLALEDPSPSPPLERVAVIVPGSPGRIVHVTTSLNSPAPGHYSVARDGIHYGPDPNQEEWVAEALNRKLSPQMKERIRKALQASSGASFVDEPAILSPTTHDLLRMAYEAAADAEQTSAAQLSRSSDTKRGASHRVLYDAIYGKYSSQSTPIADQTEPEFAEFRGWLDRIFEEPEPVQRSVLTEVIDRVRNAWRGKDTTRLDRQAVQQLRRAIRDAEVAGYNGQRHLYTLVETESDGNTMYGTETDFEQWLHSIFGEFPSMSPPRSSSPTRSSPMQTVGTVRNEKQWTELERPLFERAPKPALSVPKQQQVEAAGGSPWGEPWQPSGQSSDVFGPSTASLFSIAAAGELAVDEMNRQGQFDQYLPRRERWKAPDNDDGYYN